jgi:hypothetical protein
MTLPHDAFLAADPPLFMLKDAHGDGLFGKQERRGGGFLGRLDASAVAEVIINAG